MPDLHNNIPERTNVQDGIPANRNDDPTEFLDSRLNPNCFGSADENVPSCTCRIVFSCMKTYKSRYFREAGEEMTEKMQQVRQALADYIRSEGCSCCQNVPAHQAAAERLAKLLDVPRFDDNSGYDFWSFATPREGK